MMELKMQKAETSVVKRYTEVKTSEFVRYEVVLKKFAHLVEAVRPVVVQFAVNALSKSLISEHNKCQAENPFVPDYDRASVLMSQILPKIKDSDAHFDAFVGILQDVNITQLAFELKRAVDPRIEFPESRGHSDSGKASQEKVVSACGFQCPCGQCSLEEYFLKVDRSSCLGLKETFPYLNMSHLREHEKETLEHQLIDDADSMIGEFQKLFNVVFEALKENKQPVSDIKSTVFSSAGANHSKPIRTLHGCDLQTITTVSDLKSFLICHKYISFVNYGILEKIVDEHCKECQKALQSYLKKFKDFSRRNVFEVPSYSFVSSSTSGNLLVVKVIDEMWFGAERDTPECSFTMNEVKSVQIKIAKVIGLDHRFILLKDVAKGCIQLAFTVFSCQEVPISPLTSLQLSELKRFGIIVLYQPNVPTNFQDIDSPIPSAEESETPPIPPAEDSETPPIPSADKHRKKVLDALKELDDDRQALDEVSGAVLTRCQNLSSLQSDLKKEISTSFVQLEESIKARKEELLLKVDSLTQPPLKTFEEFKQRLETLQTQVAESQAVIDSNLKHKGPTGILSIEHSVLTHLAHLKSQCQSIEAVQEIPTVTFQNPEGLSDATKSCEDVPLDHNSSIRSSSPLPGHNVYSLTPVSHDPFSGNLLLEALSTQVSESLDFSALSIGRSSFLNQSDDDVQSTIEPRRSRDVDSLISGVPVRTIDDFNRPSGITVANNIIVCEFGLHQVLVLDYLGRKMLTIGTQGEEDGHFLFPQKAVFTHDGKMIITDGNCRFQIFCPEGQWLRTVDTDFNPASITIGSDRRAYVCNKVGHEIRIFNSDLTLHKKFGHRGTKNCEFNSPSGIVADLNGHIYIADTWNHRIQVLKEDLTFVRKFGTKGLNPGQLNSPSNLCLDPEGRFLFVSEGRNHRVSVFRTDDGQFVKCFGRHGSGLGELDRPRGITMDFNRLLYVCDYGNNRIQIFK